MIHVVRKIARAVTVRGRRVDRVRRAKRDGGPLREPKHIVIDPKISRRVRLTTLRRAGLRLTDVNRARLTLVKRIVRNED